MKRFISLVTLLLVCGACAGTPLQVDGGPIRDGERSLGAVEGNATGIMLFDVIPIGQNTRFGTAHKRAIEQNPGTTRIADMTISENWFWAYILNGYKTKIQGTAVTTAPQ
jgi:hypothetical protein